MHRAPLILILALVLALPAANASAAVCANQPGQGAIDQYCELVPSGAGSSSGSSDSGSGSGSSSSGSGSSSSGSGSTGEAPAQQPASTVPATTHSELAGSGADGKAVEDLAKTSPATHSRQHPPAATATPVATTSQPDAVSSISADAVAGPGGHSWLPWALVAVALAAGAAALWRRRSSRA